MFRPFGNFSIASRHSLIDMVTAHQRGAGGAGRTAMARSAVVDTEGQAPSSASGSGSTSGSGARPSRRCRRASAPMATIGQRHPRERIGRSVKCVILDLDNTPMGRYPRRSSRLCGIESARVSHIVWSMRVSRTRCLQLRSAGVSFAISSKNDEANVLRVLAEHPDMFSSTEIREDLRKLRRQGEQHPRNPAGAQHLDGFDGVHRRQRLRAGLRADGVARSFKCRRCRRDPGRLLSALTMWNLFEVGSFSPEDSERTGVLPDRRHAPGDAGQGGRSAAYLRALNMVAEVSRSTVLPRRVPTS